MEFGSLKNLLYDIDSWIMDAKDSSTRFDCLRGFGSIDAIMESRQREKSSTSPVEEKEDH